MKKHNIFITFEGGEGAGKSTVSKVVKNKLEKKGQVVYLTREPGGKDLPFAEDIRKIIMKHGDIDPITELLLFNASRREHVAKKITKHLEMGELVISDRFQDSTIVYQGMVKGIDIQSILSANYIAVGEYSPKYVFIFDLDPIIGLKRILDNERETNRFDNEGLNFHKEVREGYLTLAKNDINKYVVLDATKNPDELADKIIDVIENGINNIDDI